MEESGWCKSGGSEASRHPAPTTRDVLLDTDPSDPSFALKLALACDLTFGPLEYCKAFDVIDIVKHGRQAIVEEIKKSEGAEQRVAELEKQKRVLEIFLGEFKSNFESALDEIGISAFDFFKYSSALDAYTLREFVKEVDACKDLIRAIDYHVFAKKIKESMKENLEKSDKDLKTQVLRWEMDRNNGHLSLLDMHIDLNAQSDHTFKTLRP
ncbi:hypothetical protein LWI29_009947 [Acer saccharum]|uniref:Uncharacterized protein n=1 Tax=Acer saccharum TaxID=4024 RepID=A0AA39VSS2_ACESA|nr:hypothetical protein LWI29_009947 [Acer saccharum]